MDNKSHNELETPMMEEAQEIAEEQGDSTVDNAHSVHWPSRCMRPYPFVLHYIQIHNPAHLLIIFKYLQTAFNNAALPWSRHSPYTSAGRDWSPQTLIVMNQITTGDQLLLVSKIEKIPQRQSTNRTRSVPAARTQIPSTTLPMYIGGGIPPIPGKLVRRIQKDNFIDMAELLFANLEIANATDEDHSKVNGHKLQ